MDEKGTKCYQYIFIYSISILLLYPSQSFDTVMDGELLHNSAPEENEKSEPFSNRKQVRIFLVWWAMRDSNPQLTGYEPVALTVKLMARMVIGAERF